ncbi:hypothetical protein FA95DRAFT_1555897 [Auriscalpium vulgare]|uniref:Uncharacterized protein n=1 Tax=Auriscalpium vulgare TaxID=40419 RepID=A0ACB8S2B6_9AGAM|nr:hypothetical protein FA95DRAFT_1555897 [Auriscalpium vulgare]
MYPGNTWFSSRLELNPKINREASTLQYGILITKQDVVDYNLQTACSRPCTALTSFAVDMEVNLDLEALSVTRHPVDGGRRCGGMKCYKGLWIEWFALWARKYYAPIALRW